MAGSGDAVTPGDPAPVRQAPFTLRADSAYYCAAFCGAVRRVGARFSVMVKMDLKIAAVIAAIG